jgi:hypothetical protein
MQVVDLCHQSPETPHSSSRAFTQLDCSHSSPGPQRSVAAAEQGQPAPKQSPVSTSDAEPARGLRQLQNHRRRHGLQRLSGRTGPPKFMSKADDASDPAPDNMIERVKIIAHALGLSWDGHGRPVREQLFDGRVVWRVHDNWIPTGGFADVDAASGELVHIEEGQPDRDAPEQALPERLIPEDSELIAFARAKLTAIGWVLPETVLVTAGSSAAVWRLSSGAVANAVLVEIGGRRGNLHIRRLSRA